MPLLAGLGAYARTRNTNTYTDWKRIVRTRRHSATVPPVRDRRVPGDRADWRRCEETCVTELQGSFEVSREGTEALDGWGKPFVCIRPMSPCKAPKRG